jgi:hypothetical protein
MAAWMAPIVSLEMRPLYPGMPEVYFLERDHTVVLRGPSI